LTAEAQRESQVLRGEGDLKSLVVIADATREDPAFYAFYRSLEAYRKSFGKDDTTMVLSPKSEFFHYFDVGATPLLSKPAAPVAKAVE